ncbi:GGDEF domain-containing response regulator [Archangium lansingense]|uniref:diguanylate cyclase n=1 Tax=Archangium lansingense TaxID=2995310 RepID=A0ABT4AFI5_9BACT|nr:diguanylate cyclase [Archangium lansinium]MCY1080444.1 diguanylate cyclase [Archangium lansinium]
MGDRRLILLVDELPERQAELASTLEQEGFSVRLVSAGSEAQRLLAEADLVLLVLGPAGGPSRALLQHLMARDDDGTGPSILALVPTEERAAVVAVLRLGAEVVRTPADTDELVARMGKCLQERERLNELLTRVTSLERLSVTDGLTGVHNHRYFQERLREEFRRAQRYDDTLSLILIDLDHFKAFNDTHGHQVGDIVLRDVAASLQRSVRETDLLARYGGEEFAILLPRTPLAGALTVAERVWRELGVLLTGPERTLRVTASLGVSTFPHHAVNSAEQLVHSADQALYRAKDEGRNRICLYVAPSPFDRPTPR